MTATAQTSAFDQSVVSEGAGEDLSHPLEGLRIVDLSTGIAGGYCTKVLADGGADVVKVELPGGDPLRQWSIGRPVPPDGDGALFEFLACSKRSVVVDPERADHMEEVLDLVRSSDAVVWSDDGPLVAVPSLHPVELHSLAPHAIVAAITPFGLHGPWAAYPASDITLQAWAGGIVGRGTADRPPIQCGGRPGAWLGGLFAAVGILSSWPRTVGTGDGELLDVSVLECLVVCQQMYAVTGRSMMPPDRAPEPASVPTRYVNIPSVERTKDGWVGFMVATATMWESFCVMVEHPEWLEDKSLYAYAGRLAQRPKLDPAIRSWMSEHTTAEVLDAAALLRVPAAPVGTGETTPTFDHFRLNGFYLEHPTSGVLQPDVPYRLGSGASRRLPSAPPRLGEHRAQWRSPGRVAGSPSDSASSRARPSTVLSQATGSSLPLAGMRVADFTAFWAGPMVGNYLGMLGADVLHVESVKHPDGMRGHSVRTTEDEQWWEWTPRFHGPNTNKRGVTIDMESERGRALARRLIAECDVMVENFSPRVLSHWGLEYEDVKALRPDIILLRMPAFGLRGPWRDRTGYAQNMEQVSGMAWSTGYADGPPVVPNGMCDPVAGTHATLALLLALEYRRRTGRGMQVEVAMVGSALNVAAEATLEFGAYGHVVERDGNRGPTAVPQNLYLTKDVDAAGRPEGWVAIAVETDDQWRGLCDAVDRPDWRDHPRFRTAEGRRAAVEEIDAHLRSWCHQRTGDEIVATLWPVGVPVGKAIGAGFADQLPQLQARQFFEPLTHPLTGETLHSTYPVRFSNGPSRYQHRPAPTLGQDNHDIFCGLLGLSEGEFAELERDDIIGNRLVGEHRTR